MSEREELLKEIEELPEEGAELGPAPEEQQAEAPPEPQPEPEAPQPPQPEAPQPPQPQPGPPEGEEQKPEDELLERRKRLREIVEMYRDVASVAKTLSELPPEDRAWVHSIVEKVLSEEEKPRVKVVEKPVVKVVERPRVQVVEKPVPVVPPTVEEAGRKAVEALERVEELEGRLTKLELVLERLAETQKETAQAIKTVTSVVIANQRLIQELQQLRRELEEIKKREEQQFMILPKAEKLNPDGSVVREYDYHPALKALEKRTDFAVNTLGPALVAELRAFRADVSTGINRLITLMESIVTPALRQRAPRIIEDVEERLRRLVGSLAPEERERELEELEKTIEEKTRAGGGKT